MNRQQISWLVAALAVLALPAQAQDPAQEDPAPDLLTIWPDDRVFGNSDAPVTIFEFSSLTCPHCAAFHIDTLPEVKSELIDAGLANLVIRHFPLDQLAMNAALVAECVPPGQYYSFIDVLYTTQADWAGSDDPMQTILRTAMLAGVPEGSLRACMEDEAVLNGILAVRLRAQTELGITSTPTFFVGGEMIRGAQPYDVFAEAVETAAAAAPAEEPAAQAEPESQPEPESPAEPESQPEPEDTTE